MSKLLDLYNRLARVLDLLNTDDLTQIPALFCSLRHNDLGEQTGVALGKALKINTSLQNLE